MGVSVLCTWGRDPFLLEELSPVHRHKRYTLLPFGRSIRMHCLLSASVPDVPTKALERALFLGGKKLPFYASSHFGRWTDLGIVRVASPSGAASSKKATSTICASLLLNGIIEVGMVTHFPFTTAFRH